MFDLGAIVGSILLGIISDKMYQKRSPIAMIAILISGVISYTITYDYDSMTITAFFIIMFLFGFF
jgi:sugar phosphate permease